MRGLYSTQGAYPLTALVLVVMVSEGEEGEGKRVRGWVAGTDRVKREEGGEVPARKRETK